MRRRRDAGFTLLEIIVALAVFGFLLVGLSQTVRFGLTAWQQNAKLSEGKTDLEAVDRSLRAVVENLSPGTEAATPSVDGFANGLTGVTALRLPNMGLDPLPVEAALTVSGSRLVLRWRRFHHWASFATPARFEETELIGGVARLGIESWRSPGVWVARWHEPDLPLLIRFRVVFAGTDAPRWPDIIAAPLLSRP